MSPPVEQPGGELDVNGARRAILRYQPASNWVSTSRDPTPRMTVGLGFDVTRPAASEMLTQVGLDPAAVRSGRMPVSDAEMSKLFDLTLAAAVEWARRRIAGFDAMVQERRWALLEVLLWLGPEGAEAVSNELAELSVPLTDQPIERSRWFDQAAEPAATNQATEDVQPSLPSKRGARGAASPHKTVFESFGLVGELVSDDRALLREAEAMLPPGWHVVGDQPTVQFGVWTSGVITVNGVGMDWVGDRARSMLRLGAIVRHHLATVAPTYTFVHAGVVDAGGCGIVIPGRSFTGKSTLVAELVRLGAIYGSDEYAVVDSEGMIHPFAKPLSIRAGRHDRLGQLMAVPKLQVANDPIRAGIIVLTGYAPGSRWRPAVGSAAEGALALLQNTVSARLRPDSALRATSRLARGAMFLAGQRGEARDTARALLETALLLADRFNTFPA